MRGCVALERGPLVYCLESTDQEPGIQLEAVAALPHPTLTEQSPEPALGGAVPVAARGALRAEAPREGWPYAGAGSAAPGPAVDLRFIPYHAWGNRGLSTMRVWVPEA